jgi:hypothetical protein
MAFKLKHTNVESMLGKGPKMYGEEGPKNMENVLAGKDAAQGPMMYEEGPKLHDEFTKENNIVHDGAKSKGPKSHKTTKTGKVIFHGKEIEERKNTKISPKEQAIRAKLRKKQEDKVTNNQ